MAPSTRSLPCIISPQQLAAWQHLHMRHVSFENPPQCASWRLDIVERTLAAIGAKNVEEMAVQIRMKLNPDGTLRESRIVDRFRMETNPTYKAVAESALRAVRNPRCNKFTLPLQKYDVWKDMVLRFNPSEMVGR